MTVYATVDDVPSWDLLTDFDTLTIAEGAMVVGVLRLRPAVGGDARLRVAVSGDADLKAA